MPDFRGMMSTLAALVALVCGIVSAIVMAISGNWWGLLMIPSLPIAAIVAMKLLLGDDA
jgi:hypothetical protein